MSGHQNPSRKRLGGCHTTADLATLTGATYRQINYWVTQGYIVNIGRVQGSGNTQRFTDRERRRTQIYAALAQADMSDNIGAVAAALEAAPNLVLSDKVNIRLTDQVTLTIRLTP